MAKSSDEDSQSSSSSCESVELELAAPPDGGWGWMVVFASFMIHVIADGVAYAFGVLFTEITEFFHSGKGEAAWIASLLIGMTFLTGPLASALTNKFGCRTVTIAGAILFGGAFAVSCLGPNVPFLFFTIGIIGGVGMGLIYLPAIVSVGYYFEKRRSLATGLAVCGSGVGTFVFAPLMSLLIQYYAWRGALLIVSGIVLNIILFGATFRPLEMRRVRKSSPNSTNEESENSNEVERLETKPEEINHELKQPLLLVNGIEPPDDTKPSPQTNGFRSVPSLTDTRTALIPAQKPMILSEASLHKRKHHERRHHHQHRPSHNTLMAPMLRADALYTRSLTHIPQYRQDRDQYIKSMFSIGSDQNLEGKKEAKLCCCTVSKQTYVTVTSMLDFTLLKQWQFLLFVLSNFFTQLGFNTPFLYLPDRARELGIGLDKGAFLLSVVGISNTVGRAVFGALCDRNPIASRRMFVYAFSLTICGLSTSFSALCTNYASLIAYAAVFGFTVGTYVTLTPIICVDLVGLEKLSNSFGVTLLFQGVATLIGLPIAGWVHDGLGSYDYSFVLMGAMLAISGMMLIPIDIVEYFQNRRKNTS